MARRIRLTRSAPIRSSAAIALASTLALGSLAACTASTKGSGSTSTSSGTSATRSAPPTSASSAASTSASSSGSSGGGRCPTSYPSPDPDRPRIALAFTVASSLTTVRGTETVAFTPDRPITELVFRLTANTKPTVEQGNRIVVTAASADHGGGAFRFSRANAATSTQGGLLHIPFGSRIAAGTTVHARLAFTLTLGRDSFDRFGVAGRYAYFGSGQPLLAWERGYGWHTEAMLDFTAESATSEAADTTLSVTAPAADTVIASGDPADPPRSGATRTWRSRIAAARDVSVAVGPFTVTDTTVNGVRLRVGADDTATRDALVPEFRRAITQLARRFGPFPFPSLSVARVPTSGGGIEYPSSILMLDSSRLVAVHETAHQWFYAMVGDSQARHAWLDEAFAQYAEGQVDDRSESSSALQAPGPVDATTESYGADGQSYYFTTYNKGAAALEAARRAAGPQPWDAALKCYVAANAWRIVDPQDLARALAGLPAATAVLRRAGALP